MEINKHVSEQLIGIGIFVVVTIICARILVPVPGGVPFTLQAWSIALAGMLLGPRKGAAVAVIYLLLGTMISPAVFGFATQIPLLKRPMAGFIFSLPLLAFLAGWGKERGGWGWLYLGMILGVCAKLTVGVCYFFYRTTVGFARSVEIAMTSRTGPALAQIILLPLLAVGLQTLAGKVSKLRRPV